MILFKTKSFGISASFMGKNQAPFFMLTKEFYDAMGEIYFAKSLIQIWLPGQKKKFMQWLQPYKYSKYIIVSPDYPEMYLGWQPYENGVDIDSNYFWTWPNTISELIDEGYNTVHHPFLFLTKREARKKAKNLDLGYYTIEKYSKG